VAGRSGKLWQGRDKRGRDRSDYSPFHQFLPSVWNMLLALIVVNELTFSVVSENVRSLLC